ncbi:MAG: NAD(P)H-dependent oxidoreductase [Marinibacterium sp.]
MQFLAISGSGRAQSTNSALLRGVAGIARPVHEVTVFADIAGLPVFSPDLENHPLPSPVAALVRKIRECDGLILSSPEYVRSIPGGLKNAIDWLVSREEIIGKPVGLMHGSHRGDDMLDQLRLVLSTVSDRFTADPFLRFDVLKSSPEEIARLLQSPEQRAKVRAYLDDFAHFCRNG